MILQSLYSVAWEACYTLRVTSVFLPLSRALFKFCKKKNNNNYTTTFNVDTLYTRVYINTIIILCYTYY